MFILPQKLDCPKKIFSKKIHPKFILKFTPNLFQQNMTLLFFSRVLLIFLRNGMSEKNIFGFFW